MRNRIFYLIPILAIILACEKNPLDVDISNINYSLDVVRVDKELNADKSLESTININEKLNKEYRTFYSYYTSEIIQVGMPEKDSTGSFLNLFVKDSIMQIIQNDIDDLFGDFSTYKMNIERMFKYLKFHIPNAILPQNIITYNSTFTNGVLSSDSMIGVGLEMFLGSDNEIVKEIKFPEYFKAKMTIDYFYADIAQSWLTANVIEDQSSDSFISNMIYYGKLFYLIESMLPKSEPRKIVRYSEDEFKWANENEYKVWQYIVEQNWVYSNDVKVKMRYFKPAPSTVGFEGSPSKLGQYIGWNIIRQYMNKHSEVTIKEMVAETNFTKILKSYKPSRK